MDPVKLIIFIAVFALLLIVGRVLSSRHSDVIVPPPPSPHPSPTPHQNYEIAQQETTDRQELAVTGAEIPFPIKLPPVRMEQDGRYNRPHITNYYFKKIDLARGPADPSSFCDEFFLETRDPATEHTWTRPFMVATPAGLQQVLQEERFVSMYFDQPLLIVSRWDLREILQTITDEVLKAYAIPGDDGIEVDPAELNKRPKA